MLSRKTRQWARWVLSGIMSGGFSYGWGVSSYDGRMYPPQADSKRATENPRVTRYRSKQHNTYIGQNGAIKIMDIRSGAPVIDKAGRDQRKVDDL